MIKKNIWKFFKVATDGKCRLFGVNVFEFKWENEGETVSVEDPQYHIIRDADVYSITVKGRKQRFAAVEVSNCVWAFYIER